jgi:CHAD domain-containing protein
LEVAADLLRRPAAEAVRRLALAYLDLADAAAARLLEPQDPEDPEALHDFRVALRRLRSCLRAYRDVLGDALSKKHLRRLRRLGRATNAGREAEVALAWVEKRLGRVRRGQRPALEALAGELREAKAAAYSRVKGEVVEDYRRLAAGLRRRLAAYEIAVDLTREETPPTLAAAVGPRLRDHASRLAADLGAVTAPDDAQLHRARISGKRLRYLLEPLRAELEPVAALLERLKRLQDLLGELHDLQVLGGLVAERLASAAAERARARFALAVEEGSRSGAVRGSGRRGLPGALAVADLLRSRRDELWGELEGGWLGGRAQELCREVEELAAGLAAEAPAV